MLELLAEPRTQPTPDPGSPDRPWPWPTPPVPSTYPSRVGMHLLTHPRPTGPDQPTPYPPPTPRWARRAAYAWIAAAVANWVVAVLGLAGAAIAVALIKSPRPVLTGAATTSRGTAAGQPHGPGEAGPSAASTAPWSPRWGAAALARRRNSDRRAASASKSAPGGGARAMFRRFACSPAGSG